jgi:hypothetical protein
MPSPPRRNGETENGGSGGKLGMGPLIRLVAVPDGMGPDDDRNNLLRLTVFMQEHMAPRVEELIRRSGEEEAAVDGDGDGWGRIRCVVADYDVGTWALDVASRTGVKSAAVWPASAAVMASQLSVPELIRDKIIDAHGK